MSVIFDRGEIHCDLRTAVSQSYYRLLRRELSSVYRHHCQSFYGEFKLNISRVLERIQMEHIYKKNSLESQLSFECRCSVRIRSRNLKKSPFPEWPHHLVGMDHGNDDFE